MKLQKTAETSALSSPAKAGDTVTYHFTGTNTGNTTLTDVTVADPLDGLSDLEYSWPGAEGVLAPGDSVTATARYRLTQADLDGGQVDNTATVTGTAPAGDAVTAEASADVRLLPSAAIDLQKTADSSAIGSPAKPGDVITYHFVGTNVGTVTVRAVVVTDGLEGLSELSYAWPGEEGVLAPGEAVTATASYPLTQADIDAGHVENRATVTATPPSGEDVTDESTADVPVAGTSELTVLKEADATAIGSPARPGDTVRFRFTVTNTGTLTMADVTVEDRLPGLSQLTYVWPGAPGVLAPGQSAIAAASYQLKESDLAAGHVANKATARGTAPNGDPTQSPPAEVDTPLPRIPLPTVSG
jgi:uncharacterized repeat protein (TIGR01451 family)